MSEWLTKLFGPRKAFQELSRIDLTSKIALLGSEAWGTKEDSKGQLYIDPIDTANPINFETIVKVFLDHARRVSPGITVPVMIPAIQVTPLIEAAGQFVEEEGWVKIALSSTFASNSSATQSILCHEVCHYILETNGIRLACKKENERLTDTAMFVFGLGRVFLAGYRQNGHINYRPGHRLGYLSDVEYKYVEREVVRLRSAGSLVPSNEDALLTRVRTRLGGDDQKVRRYLEFYRAKYPQRTENERMRDILRDLTRQ